MRKKKLLSEAQVRRFMGLAGIQPINEMSHYKKDDEMMYEEEEMGGEEEAPEAEEGGEADVEIDEQDLGDIKSALDTLQSKLAPLLDQAAGEEEMEMEPEEGEEEELEDVEVEPSPEEEEEMQEQIVNEVARRVAKRIIEAKRAHQKMNEALGNTARKPVQAKATRRK